MDVRRFLIRSSKTSLQRLAGELALASACLALGALTAHSGRVSADMTAPRVDLEASEDLLASQDDLSDEGRQELRKLIESSDPKRIDRKPGILAPPVVAEPGGTVGAPYGKKELSQGDAPPNGHYLDYSDEIPQQPREPSER